MADLDYDIGYVAFIDVLGWSQAIADSIGNAKLRETMAGAQNRVIERAVQILDPKNNKKPSFNSNTYGYQISDTHILAVPQRGSTRAGAEFVSMWCRLLAREYFKAGFLVRGGVTIGQIHCGKGVCFGPALIRAYKLEQKAVLPMILIDANPKVQSYFKDQEQYGGLSTDGAFTYNYFAETQDGRVFVDFLRKDVCTNPDYRPYDVFDQTDFNSLLRAFMIKANDPADVRVKKAWFSEYASGNWRKDSTQSLKEINFEPRTGITRRRLVPENYQQDFIVA